MNGRNVSAGNIGLTATTNRAITVTGAVCAYNDKLPHRNGANAVARKRRIVSVVT
jgi:hypothetical protein